MITKEFRRWAEDIKDLIKEQIGDLAYWAYSTQSNVIDVGIEFPEGQKFWMSFHQEEFNCNDEKGRCKIVEIRHRDLVRKIKDFAEKVAKTVEKLQ